MLRFSILFFISLLLLSACKTRKEKLMSLQSEKKLKVVKHKNQNPTLENSDFLYNTESDEELKKHFKKNKEKRKELEQYQPSRRNSNNMEFERKKKTPPKSNTHY